jgi:dTMP kinase
VLIAFEGLDQSGKETQVRRLAARLQAEGEEAETLAFPCYRTEIAQEIARALRGERAYPADVLQLLYIANRYEYRARIAECLAAGRHVLCDRYLASSVAYGEAFGLDADWLFDVQRHLPQPDLTIVLDIRPATAVSRKARGRDLFEQDLALLGRVRDSYLRQAQRTGWWVIDGEQSPDAVEDQVVRLVRARRAPPSGP